MDLMEQPEGKKGQAFQAEINLSHLNSQKINQISASLLHAIKESEDEFGHVDYTKAESLLKNECNGLVNRGYKSGHIGLTKGAHEGKEARDHYKEKFENIYDEVTPDFTGPGRKSLKPS